MIEPAGALVSRSNIRGRIRRAAKPLADAPFGMNGQEPEFYSATCIPEPPNSAGKSLNFGSPSRIGKTVSA